jgi:hypothetical protein
MGEKQVFVLSELGETYIGTVNEILGLDEIGEGGGQGESIVAVLADLVGALVSDVLAGDSTHITIELRERHGL